MIFLQLLNPYFWRSIFEALWYALKRPRRFGALIEYYGLVKPGTAAIMFGRFAKLHPDVAIAAAIRVRKAAAAAGFQTVDRSGHLEWMHAQNALYAAIDAGLIPASTMRGLVAGNA